MQKKWKLILKKEVARLAKKYELKLVMLFGSSSRGSALTDSDIDLAILANENFYEKKYSDFSYDLTEVENTLKKNIDIVPISNYNPLLLYNIFNDGEALYIRDEDEYASIRSWARFSYEDNQRFFYDRNENIKKRLRRL